MDTTMRVIKIPCKIDKSLFPSEHRASFSLNGTLIETICDASLVEDHMIELMILEESEDGSVLALVPGELLRGCRRLRTTPSYAKQESPLPRISAALLRAERVPARCSTLRTAKNSLQRLITRIHRLLKSTRLTEAPGKSRTLRQGVHRHSDLKLAHRRVALSVESEGLPP